MLQMVKVEIEVGKETKEIIDFVSDLIKDIKAGKDMAAIAAENLPGLISAVGGFQELPAEMQGPSLAGCVGYAGSKVVEALKG
jgi:hypothetical protein